jgi:4-hydroxybutyrate CoA-transferase
VSFFVGENVRKARVAEGRADFVPVFLSDIPALFTAAARSRSTSRWCSCRRPIATAVLARHVGRRGARRGRQRPHRARRDQRLRMPRTHGNTSWCRSSGHTRSSAPTGRCPGATSPRRRRRSIARIGELVAELVEDGATLQAGIGAIPDAVLARLGDHARARASTPRCSPTACCRCIEGGVITNRAKAVHPGRTVTSFVTGTQRLYDFVDDNPAVEFHGCDRTNDTALIRKNDKVTAINSALEIDLTGQVCADSLGHAIYSGIGGQMDFLRGAALSRGGKPIIALPSTAAAAPCRASPPS